MEQLTKFAVAFSTSTILSETLTLDTLWTTLITFGVSVVTLVGGELIKLAVAYLKKKQQDIDKTGNKGEE